MEPLRPNAQRAKTAVTLIWIVFFVEILSLASDLLQYQLLQSVASGNIVTEEAASANDLRQRIIGIIYITVFIISAVTFIQWFRRAYFNLHLRVNHLSENEGMAAGSWFIPFYNLVKPYRIMKELYEETQILLHKGSVEPLPVKGKGVIGWWWALWLLNNFTGQVSFRMSKSAEGIGALISATTLSMVNSIIGLIVAVITVKVIHDYSAMETALVHLKKEEINVGSNPDLASPADLLAGGME